MHTVQQHELMHHGKLTNTALLSLLPESHHLHLCDSRQAPLPLQSKLAESEDKVAAMAVQLEQLHADRLRLENRNSVLEKVTYCTLMTVLIPSYMHAHLCSK